MKSAPRALWVAIGAALLLLPALPLPMWSGAPDPGPPWSPHVVSWGWGILVVVVVALLVGRLAAQSTLPAFDWRAPRDRWMLLALAVLLGVAAACVMQLVFAGNPHLVDEIAQLLHARAFAAGRLALPPPQPLEAFLIIHTWVTDAGWVSQFPPGQTVLFAIGFLLNAEWLVNPVLGGAGVVLVYLVARGLYGVGTARAAAVLWAVSAWVMFMSATYMNHVGAVTFALAAWAVLWAYPAPGTRRFAAAGLLIGFATATRPLDGMAAALPVLIWIMSEKRWRGVLPFVLGGLPVALAWGLLNWRLYGHPLTMGYTAVWGPELRLGFHVDPWGDPFTPLVALSNAAVAIRRLHIYMYEWPVPALLLLAVWALVARHRSRSDLIVAVGLVAAPLLYFFYWHSGFRFGPRFYYAAAPMLVIGLARAWRWVWVLAMRTQSRALRWDVALVTAAVVVLLWGWVGLLPARMDVYRHGLQTLKLHPERQLEELGVKQALVMMPGSWGSRIAVDLWGLGVPPSAVETAYRETDACDLYHFVQSARSSDLPTEEVLQGLQRLQDEAPDSVLRVEGWPDPTLKLIPDRDLAADCLREMQRDLEGFTLYGYLAWRNPIGLNSGLVFARDRFEENDELLPHYEGWAVWRFTPPSGQPNAMPVLSLVRPASEEGGP